MSSQNSPLLAPKRLGALRQTGLLDLAPDPSFDRITKLATRLLDVPVALVSLVDADRQFFKSATGLPEQIASQRQTPLSHSFCQHVVATGAALVVDDAPNHPVVCDNLAIRDLGVAAYLGVPLVTAEGHALGALCAIDTKIHAWSAQDVATLTELAGIVMSEITLRGEIARREDAEWHQNLLVEELRHRVKNTLAMSQALVSLSLRTSSSLEDFRANIGGRINALSNAHMLLIDRQWGSVRVRDLIAGELAAVGPERFNAAGPDVIVPSTIAVNVSMVVHELATNAIKYGALSTPDGRVSLVWRVDPETDGARLVMDWHESGGPPVSAPARRGFGTLLFSRLAGDRGHIAIDYPEQGVRAHVAFFVPQGVPDYSPQA